MNLGIGIDTGGTFTDSVVVDLDSGNVLSKAKALTTRHDLRVGIENSLASLDRSLFKKAKLVSLSTTLATNSVVEGKGARVGLIVAVPNPGTFKLPVRVPAVETAIIAGAHDIRGVVSVDLDVAAASEAVRGMAEHVDAFAVSCYFSIYSAEHEARIRDIVYSTCGRPVVCGHELSGDVGLVERAVTASLNARLLPVIRELLDAVKETLKKNGIAAPLMVAKGDGSLIVEEIARTRPVETILSGPAASIVGACRLTGLVDAVVADMGGTTTDIAVVNDRRASTSPEGAMIGGWQTRVKAADVWTAGLGGDSKISVTDSKEIRIGPRRAIPLCFAAHAFPPVKQVLEDITQGDGKDERSGLDFYTLSKRPAFALSKYEAALIESLDGKTLHRSQLDREFAPFINLERLIGLGFVAEVSFTPTDLLNARGDTNLWDKEASESAVRYYARVTGLDAKTLCETILTDIVESLKLDIAGKVLCEGAGEPNGRSPEVRAFLGRLLRRDFRAELSAAFGLKRPIVAVGAPAKAFFPRVASELGARLVIPEHAEVANAVGAVTGSVVEVAQAYIRPDKPFGFVVVTEDGHRSFDELDDALVFGEQYVRDTATMRASESGGRDIEASVAKEDTVALLAANWGGNVLIELKLTARAVGKPNYN